MLPCMDGVPARAVRLALLLAALGLTTARLVPGKLAKPDYTLYHTKDGVFQAVQEIVQKCPDIMRIDEETEEQGGYSSTLTVVTVEPAGLSGAGSTHDDKMRLLLNFGEHGRELISSEIGLSVLRLLCDQDARRPLLEKYKLDPAAVKQLLQRAVFKIVPMENVKGRERVEAGQLCERKNGRGVDPNRNWAVDWGVKEKDYDPSEEYPGTAAFSEPEAALMLRTARALRPHVWASVHSGMAALFMPYDHKATIPDGPGPAATMDILTQLNERTCSNKCATGSGGKSVGYLAHGTATDFMHQELHVPVAMTWEVYGDQKAHFDDCFRMFNPLTRQGYDRIVESWTAAVFTLLSLLPQHPDVAAELGPVAGAAGGAAGEAQAGAGAGSGGGGGGSEDTKVEQPEEQGQQQQQQQQRQQEQQEAQGGSGMPGREATAAAGANASADKAVEIASALKQHLQQEADAEQQAGAEQQEAAGAATAAGKAKRSVRRGALPRRRSRLVLLLYWLAALVAAMMVVVSLMALGAGLGLASYLWSKPRFRYLLSKQFGRIGMPRRRGRGLIPV